MHTKVLWESLKEQNRQSLSCIKSKIRQHTQNPHLSPPIHSMKAKKQKSKSRQRKEIRCWPVWGWLCGINRSLSPVITLLKTCQRYIMCMPISILGWCKTEVMRVVSESFSSSMWGLSSDAAWGLRVEEVEPFFVVFRFLLSCRVILHCLIVLAQ